MARKNKAFQRKNKNKDYGQKAEGKLSAVSLLHSLTFFFYKGNQPQHRGADARTRGWKQGSHEYCKEPIGDETCSQKGKVALEGAKREGSNSHG